MTALPQHQIRCCSDVESRAISIVSPPRIVRHVPTQTIHPTQGSYTTPTERNHGSCCLDKLADTSIQHVSPCPKPITLRRRVRMHSRSHIPPPVIVLPAASDYRNHENMPPGPGAVTQADQVDAMAKRACRTTRKCLYCVHTVQEISAIQMQLGWKLQPGVI